MGISAPFHPPTGNGPSISLGMLGAAAVIPLLKILQISLFLLPGHCRPLVEEYFKVLKKNFKKKWHKRGFHCKRVQDVSRVVR
jgi:hypothetical protein